MKRNYISGFSLIELVIAIIIISISVAGFATLFNTTTVHSVDPMLQQQANAIARAYLEEVSLRSFCDPDVTNDCPVDCTAGSTCSDASCGIRGETRDAFDDVCDYDGLSDTGVRDQTNNPVASLSNYNVTVTVFDNASADLNGLLGGSSQSLRIDVNVTHVSNTDINTTISGYRINF